MTAFVVAWAVLAFLAVALNHVACRPMSILDVLESYDPVAGAGKILKGQK